MLKFARIHLVACFSVILVRENDESTLTTPVLQIGSRQYIVMPGRYIYTQRLKGANVNDQVL